MFVRNLIGSKNKPNQVMIDIESVDTVSSSAVLSIGLVAFTLFDKTKSPRIKDYGIHSTYYVELDVEEQEMLGRTKSADTLAWWAKQKPGLEQFTHAWGSNNVNNSETLINLHHYLKTKVAGMPIWAKWYDFDLGIISSLFSDYSLDTPWKYSGRRCFGTVNKLYSETQTSKLNFPSNPHLHDALQDAIHQTKCLQMMMGYTPTREDKESEQ